MEKYHFTVYINSQNPNSAYVIERLRGLCSRYLMDSYTINVLDLHKDQPLFEENRVYAVPAIEVTTPQSQKHRFVGDLSNSDTFIMAIGMKHEAIRMGAESAAMKEEAIKMRDKLKNP